MSVKSELRRVWAFWLFAIMFVIGAVFCFARSFSASWVNDHQLIAHAQYIANLAGIGFVVCEIAAWITCLKIVTKPSQDTLLGRLTVAGVLTVLLHIPVVLALVLLK
jgi:hypothetical protein